MSPHLRITSARRPCRVLVALVGLVLALGCITHPYPAAWSPLVKHKPGEPVDLTGCYRDAGELPSDQGTPSSIYGNIAHSGPNPSLKYNLHSHGYSFGAAYAGVGHGRRLLPAESVRLEHLDAKQVMVMIQPIRGQGEKPLPPEKEILSGFTTEPDWVVLNGDRALAGVLLEDVLCLERNRFNVAEDGSLVARIDYRSFANFLFVIPVYIHDMRWVRWHRIPEAPADAGLPAVPPAPAVQPEPAAIPAPVPLPEQ